MKELEVKLNNLKTKENLEKHIIENGCFDIEENTRIYNKFFKNSPRYLFREVFHKYNLEDKVVADVGCGFGMPLPFLTKESYGLDYEGKCTKFANSIGLNVYERDIIADDVLDLPKADVVWNSAVMEHVDSPHILLRKMWQLLKPNGLLLLYVPTIPLIRRMKNLPKVGKYFIGHTHGDHVAAYTPRTIEFFCKYAGFDTVEVSHFYPGALKILNSLPLIDGVVYVGRKNENWEYPENATRRKAENEKGFVLRDDITEPFSH